MTALATLLLLGLACWALKVLFVAVVPGDRLPRGIRNALEHLPPAVLAAIVASTATATLRGDAAPQAVVAVLALLVVGIVHRGTGRLVLAIGIACATVAFLDLVLVHAGGA